MDNNSEKNSKYIENYLKNSTEKKDIVNNFIQIKNGSIRITRIDDILEKKQIFENNKWKNVCKFKNCVNDISLEKNKNLCQYHYLEELNNNIIGEIININDRRYIWIDNEWKLLCLIESCKNVVVGIKNEKCKKHEKNINIYNSAINNNLNLFNSLQTEYEINKIKNEKLKNNKNQ